MKMFCKECGCEVHSSSVICLQCGSAVKQFSIPVVTLDGGRDRLIASVLAFLVGAIGIHKFYLGRIGQGIVYVLFCWTGIPFILGLIEGAIYLSMTNDSFNAKYNKG
jgi:hypothetical protein